MILYERQNEILKYLNKTHFASIKELSQIVWSSESSVRRDVKALERNGLVKQIYGGVVLPEYMNSVVPLNVRDSSNSPVKEELAKRAAMHIFDGAVIMMDGSSTVRRIMKYINKYHGLKIITNNQRIFDEYQNRNIDLYCTGGKFVPENNIFVGSAAEDFISRTYADILFFSSQALSEDGEISDASEEETTLRKIMLMRAKKKIFLCDSSKVGIKRTFSLCNTDNIDMIICDKPLPWERSINI